MGYGLEISIDGGEKYFGLAKEVGKWGERMVGKRTGPWKIGLGG